MKKVILVCVVAVAALFASTGAPREAEACYTQKVCTSYDSCLVRLISAIVPCRFDAQHVQGNAYVTNFGETCDYIETKGATACDGGRANLETIYHDGQVTCEVVSYATLRDLGCCQTPCPPAFPDCHDN
jgi:hypothetical protein